jgi:hypothetical protein
VRLEGLGKLDKKINDIGNRTRDCPACSIVPQPSTLYSMPLTDEYTLKETHDIQEAS